jgi:hypothetical protein
MVGLQGGTFLGASDDLVGLMDLKVGAKGFGVGSKNSGAP